MMCYMGLSRIKKFQKIRELYLRETADSFLKNCQKLLILDSHRMGLSRNNEQISKIYGKF